MKTYSKVSIIVSAVLMIIVGIIALCNPAETLVSLSWVIGIMTLISGISVMIFYFSEAKGLFGAGTVLFTGIADIILGIIFLNHSFIVSQVLAFIAGLWLTVFGIERIVRSTDLKKMLYSDWWITLIIGIVSAVLGILSMLAPICGAVLISVVVGIGFVLHGVAILTILHALKKAKDKNDIYIE